MVYRQLRLPPQGRQPPFAQLGLTSAAIPRHLLLGAVLVGVAGIVALAPLALLGLLLGGVTAGLLLLRHPWLIWPVLGALLPFTSAYKIGPITLTDLVLAGAVALWFIDGVRRRTLTITPVIPLRVLLLLIAVLYLSLLQAHDLREASAEIFKWVEFALVLALAPAMLGAAGAKWLVGGLLLGALAQALLGLYQFIFQIGPEWFIIMGRFMRASGTFHQPNPFGGYLGLALPVAASLAVWALSGLWTQSRPKVIMLRWTLWYGGATGLIGVGLLTSWSRGGWLGAVGSLGLILSARNRRTLLLSGGLGLLLGLALLIGASRPAWVPTPLAARFADVPAYLGLTDVLAQPITDENFAIVERVAHWVAAWRMWAGAPWLGVGPGNYAVVYPEVRLPRWEEPLGHAHNIYLNTLAESGIMGLLAYLLFWFTVVGWLWRQRLYAIHHDGWTNALLLGVIGMVLHLSIHNFFDNLLVQGIYLQIALWLAAVVGVRHEPQATQQLKNL